MLCKLEHFNGFTLWFGGRATSNAVKPPQAESARVVTLRKMYYTIKLEKKLKLD